MSNSYLRRTKFAMVANEAMRDEQLSIEARGLLALLCTYSTGWEFTVEHLQKVAGCGVEKFRRMMGELREHGYLILTPKQSAGGRLNGYVWEVVDDKAGGASHRATEKPSPGEVDGHIEDQEEEIPKEEEKQLSLEEPENDFSLDALWKLYPHPSSRGAKPEKNFSKLKKSEKKAFRDAIPILKASLEADHARGFMRQAPMFSTYLNQKRFVTDLEGAEAAAGPRPKTDFSGETVRWD